MLSIGPKYKYIKKPSAFKKIDNKHIILVPFFAKTQLAIENDEYGFYRH